MDPIKDAFTKVKEDMNSLKEEIILLNNELKGIKEALKELISSNNLSSNIPTDKQDIPTHFEDIPTHFDPYKPQKAQNISISTGNRGVPTNKPTNQQTNQQMENYSNKGILERNSMNDALLALNSLDAIKKEIRLKFKDLTEQEFLVFSTLYQLEEEMGSPDYRTIANKLSLSESSIRDYIGKLIKKDIPVDKIKLNNKNIKLSISENLKKITSLNTIIQLRDL